jgi:hypothetical protein
LIEDEKLLLNNKRVDLAKDLDLETRKRMEAEDAYEKLKEEFLKMELEEARNKSELQARID